MEASRVAAHAIDSEANEKIADLVGTEKRVLLVGDAWKHLEQRLTSSRCSVVTVGPCGYDDVVSPMIGTQTFDTVVFADVLEYLRDPWNVLDDVRSFLDPDGSIIAAVWNGARQTDAPGLEQRHWFSRRTVGELLIRSGYAIEQIERTLYPSTDSADRDGQSALMVDAEDGTQRYIIKGRRLDDTAKLDRLVKSYVAASAELSNVDERMATQRLTDGRQIRELEERLAVSEKTTTDLTLLQSRAARDVYELRKQFAAAAHENDVRGTRITGIGRALDLASQQVDQLNDQRVALERYCSRLVEERQSLESRTTSAESTMHAYLRDFADEFGNVGDIVERKEVLSKLRAAHPILLAEITRLETLLCFPEEVPPDTLKGAKPAQPTMGHGRAARLRRFVHRLLKRA